MALIFCPECGTQVSEQAIQCVKCSYPIYKLNRSNQKTILNNHLNTKNVNNEIGADINLIISGYIVAFFSLFLFPVILLIAGIVIGIATISKGNVGHGVTHIILSIIF